MSWTYCQASVAGTSHAKTGLPCQDFHLCRLHNGILFAFVSDGAGSASHSAIGAEVTCTVAAEEMQLQLAEHEQISEQYLHSLVDAIVEELKSKADVEGVPLRELACTFLGAVLTEDRSYFFQIGDGAIVIDDPSRGGYECVFWPQRGEYENQTNFIVGADAKEQIKFTIKERVNKVMMFSDGIQRLALIMADEIPHAPFVEVMLAELTSLDSAEDTGKSSKLAEFLNSDRVNFRTDDDKTLILAKRIPAACTSTGTEIQ